VSEGDRASSATWSLPLTSLILGVAAMPVLLLNQTSFVLSLMLAMLAALSGTAVFLGGYSWPQRGLASIGVLAVAATGLLVVLPFVLQD
jgi:hypothetical protein